MRVLFIVGFWNSGTTLLVDILRHHPKLKLRKSFKSKNLEEHTIKRILQKFGHDFFYFGDFAEVTTTGFKNFKEPQLNEKETQQFRKLFFRKLRAPKNKALLIKKPRVFFFRNFLDRTFPTGEMKKIIILRNGFSQVVSKDYWLRATNDPPEKLLIRAKFWVRAMEYYFENWHNDPDTITIRYESFCNDAGRELKKICDFAGLDFEALKNHLPKGLENRQTKWENLDEDLKQNVEAIIRNMQAKIDRELPII